MSRGFLKDILRLDQTVFSFSELALMWPEANPATIKSRIHYYVQQGDLYHIRRGLYGKDKNYNRLELATKIYSPSYISFETVLAAAGIIFQQYSQIFVASYLSKTLECDGQSYIFRRLKSTLLTDSAGIDIKNQYSIASPERAFLDMLYLHSDYYFDNLAPVDWNLVMQILPIYENKRMEEQIARLKESQDA